MIAIAKSEGLEVSDNAMEALIENCNNDIRLILNTLQMRRLSSTSLSFDDVKGAMTKDLELGNFSVVDKRVPHRPFLTSPSDAAARLLMPTDRPLSINERTQLAYQDQDIIPLFMQARDFSILLSTSPRSGSRRRIT